MTSRPRVALATSAEFLQHDEDAPPLLAALAARDVSAEAAAWEDPAVDWAGYDLVVIRSTWDYAERHADFVSWAQRVPHLLNGVDIVKWNTDKRYLTDLAAAGVPVVDTTFIGPGEPAILPSEGEYVVKPAVGAGARDTVRYTSSDAEVARLHVARLHRAGRTVMVQPYIEQVDLHGESALLYVGGQYSHSVLKGALLTAGTDVGGEYREPTIAARVPDPAQFAVAEQALRAVPGGPAQLLYARVDLLPGPAGSPLLLELELTEPHLYLGYAPGAVEQFAAAIAAAADRVVPTVTS